LKEIFKETDMPASRNIYLKMKTLDEAKGLLVDHFPGGSLSTEHVPVPEAVGRVLSEPVAARLCSPNFHSAAMDGIAVKAEATFGAIEGRPKELSIGKEAFYVNTGNPLPEGTDAVIMIEQVNVLDADQDPDRDPDRVRIEAPAFPWQYVRKMGEDIVATELIFPRGHVITPYCVGALLSGGIFAVPVREKPKIMIIPTGNELVDWQQVEEGGLKPGQIVETNSFVLGGMCESVGGRYERHAIVSDDPDKIEEAVREAAAGDANIILTVGGSSAGSQDYSKTVFENLGEILIHGVTMMPGKPVIAGRIQGKPVFGMPGYPVSNIVAFEQLVQPLICRMLGQPDRERPTLQVEPIRKIPSKLGVEEFLRVKLGEVGDRFVATPLPRGAGAITSITRADGIIRIPNHVEGLLENVPVTAELLHPLSMIRNNIVVVGSHDNTLDVLADLIRANHTDVSLSSSHVGSLGGLLGIRRGVCHLAGSHLLDTEDGSYNVSYIKRYLPEVPVKLVHLVLREQGLIVPRGNPKGIKGIEDLAGGGLRFINRQGGSGTRVLLDYRLKELGIDPSSISGYQTEEFTHMSVAVAVLGGAADVGLGIFAAAKALDLDFVPVVTEQYDLVIPERYMDSRNIRILMDTIGSGDFKKRVDELGGYSTKRTGEIIL